MPLWTSAKSRSWPCRVLAIFFGTLPWQPENGRRTKTGVACTVRTGYALAAGVRRRIIPGVSNVTLAVASAILPFREPVSDLRAAAARDLVVFVATSVRSACRAFTAHGHVAPLIRSPSPKRTCPNTTWPLRAAVCRRSKNPWLSSTLIT